MVSQFPRRFSSYLMMVIVILVAGSVVLISGTLHFYFTNRLEAEFTQKHLAQKGQLELVIGNRLAHIQGRLKDLSKDRTVIDTLAFKADKLLEKRLANIYPVSDGMYFYAKNNNSRRFCPTTHPIEYNQLLEAILAGTFPSKLDKVADTGLLWWFQLPVKDRQRELGKVYVIYDLARDTRLVDTIRRTVDGDIVQWRFDRLRNLISNTEMDIFLDDVDPQRINTGFVSCGEDCLLSRLNGFESLYFVVSKETLMLEKSKITLLIGLFTIGILAVSALLSIFLGQQMAKPLSQMAVKAMQISQGRKDLLFEERAKDYLEIRRLSRTFNYMLDALKQAEEKSRYQELFENVGDAVYMFGANGNIMDANEAACIMLDFPRSAFLKLNIREFISQNAVQRLLNLIEYHDGAPKQPKATFETLHFDQSGDSIPVEVGARAILYSGRPVVLCVARDISLRKKVEDALHASEERYRSVVECSHDGIMMINSKWETIFVNDELCRITGFDRQALEGRDFRRIVSDESIPLATDRYLNRYPGQHYHSQYDFIIRRKDGKKRLCKINVTSIIDSRGEEKIIGHVLDITEQFHAEQDKKELETQLIQAQKMQAIGTLAGGVAHDFNNLLQAIQGRVSLMLLQIKADDPNHEHLEGIENAVQSASNLTKQLLGFARGGKYETRPICFNELFDATAEMFCRTKKEIRLHKKFQKDLWTVQVDRGQMEQVLLNMFVNAAHAMPAGGDLYLATKNISLTDSFCKPHEMRPGRYIRITVTDTGVGMNEEAVGRIFEPFYTTREIGQGTGLGLASAFGIIKNHNGVITVDSTPNKGTSFYIYLPVSDSKVIANEAAALSVPKGKGTILLVDDEEQVIQVGSLMLAELGYDVLPARTGKEATRIVRDLNNGVNNENAGATPPDMVILDMVMPGMNGNETFHQLKKIQPGIKVLISSGYGMTTDVETMIDNGCLGFIQKPFDLPRLSRKLFEIMHNADTALNRGARNMSKAPG